jgi:hypothetical protein
MEFTFSEFATPTESLISLENQSLEHEYGYNDPYCTQAKDVNNHIDYQPIIHPDLPNRVVR